MCLWHGCRVPFSSRRGPRRLGPTGCDDTSKSRPSHSFRFPSRLSRDVTVSESWILCGRAGPGPGLGLGPSRAGPGGPGLDHRGLTRINIERSRGSTERSRGSRWRVCYPAQRGPLRGKAGSAGPVRVTCGPDRRPPTHWADRPPGAADRAGPDDSGSGRPSSVSRSLVSANVVRAPLPWQRVALPWRMLRHR